MILLVIVMHLSSIPSRFPTRPFQILFTPKYLHITSSTNASIAAFIIDGVN